jgi:hypothetical protein
VRSLMALVAILLAIPPRLSAQEDASAAATEAFGWLLYVGVTSNLLFEWDPDTGGYPDTFATMDKQLHAAVGYGLTQAAITAGVRPRDAVIGVTLAAVGWEFSQGYASWRDVAAGVGGSLAAWGWHELWQRRRERERAVARAPATRDHSAPGDR